MKLMILSFSFLLTTSICFVSNPLSLGLLLMLYSFFISLFIGKVMLTSWFCMILMLMMIGGLLVIFMYISSISSNEKFKLKTFPFLFVLFILMVYFDEFIFENQSFDSIFLLYNINHTESFSMVKLYNNSSMTLTIFMIVYLIFTMVVVSTIVKHFSGPLRSSNYE